MADKLGDIKVAVKSEGTEQTQEDMEEMQEQAGQIAEGGDGGGGVGGAAAKGGAIGGFLGSLFESIAGDTIKGILDLLKTMMEFVMAIAGGVGGILGIASKFEGVQAMLDAISSVLEAWFLPLAKLLIRILTPVLRWMIKNMPLVHKILNEMIDNFVSIVKFLFKWGPKLIDFIKSLLGVWAKLQKFLHGGFQMILIRGFTEIIKGLWRKMKKGINFILSLPKKIIDGLKKIFGMIMPDFGGKNPLSNIGGLMGGNDKQTQNGNDNKLINELRRLNPQTNINISGGLSSFIENVEKDPNRRGA